MKIEKPRHYTKALYVANWEDIILKNKDLRNDPFYFEIQQWVVDNLNMEYVTIADSGIYFYSSEDALHFRLTWL